MRRRPALRGTAVAAATGVAVCALAMTTACAPRDVGEDADRAVAGATASPPTAEAESGEPPGVPVSVDGQLLVGGDRVPGRWYAARGLGTHWVAQRDDGSWWWGYDAEPQRIDGRIEQSAVISPRGGYVAQVLTAPDHAWTLVGADTEEGGEGFGAVDLPRGSMSPPPRAVAVTDDALVVAGGPRFQWLWRPLEDGATVDLAETAPGQVVVGSTDAGLVINEGRYDRTDATTGAPYLARLSADGTLTRLGPVPTHDVLEATEQWVAYLAPGTIGGETWGAPELLVQRRDGSDEGVLTAPDGWIFAAPGFRWETADRLLVVLRSTDGQTEALARCRPDTESCDPVDLPD